MSKTILTHSLQLYLATLVAQMVEFQQAGMEARALNRGWAAQLLESLSLQTALFQVLSDN